MSKKSLRKEEKMLKETEGGAEAEKVSRIKCSNPACGATLDVSAIEPFTDFACPHCNTIQTVPAKFGQFLLAKKLGAGGMGVIYKAMDKELGRMVALKVMKRELSDDQEFVSSFKREAQAAAQLNHPNVVQIYSFGQYSGQYYIVMELVTGGRLDVLIEGNKSLPEMRALEIHYQIALGLNAASDVGLVHGDVKPANILFRIYNEYEVLAKIVDFGLACRVGQKQQKDGVIWGTPYYIAPEKARGKTADFRSDIYSLGATLFQTLVGVPPFEGKTPTDVVMARLKQPAPDLDEVCPGKFHRATINMVARMLEQEPAMRYPSWPALILDMKAALDESKMPLSPAKTSRISKIMSLSGSSDKGKISVQSQQKRRKAVIWGLMGLAVVAIIASISLGYSHYQKKKAEEAEIEAIHNWQINAQDTYYALEKMTADTIGLLEKNRNFGVEANNFARKIDTVNKPIGELMEISDTIEELICDLSDNHAFAYLYAMQVMASTNSLQAETWYHKLEECFNRTFNIKNTGITPLTTAGEKAIKEAKEQLEELQDELRERERRATEAREAARLKAIEEKRKQEEAKAKEAEAKAKEAEAKAREREKPKFVQKELDLIDKTRGENVSAISRKDFESALEKLKSIEGSITWEESKLALKRAIASTEELIKFKEFLVNTINKTPARQAWVINEKLCDVVRADTSKGISVSVGGYAITSVPWPEVNLQQLTRIISFYINNLQLESAEKAKLIMQIALLNYESGSFKQAELLAQTAVQTDASIKERLLYLMPDLISE
jgi:serine/threonine protein kinase